MRKALLAISAVFLLASFANNTSKNTILKDIDGTLLQSYAVINNADHTVTFTVDANTTVTSSVIDGEFRIFLLENGNSNTNISYTLNTKEAKTLSFDNYFEANFDVASTQEEMLVGTYTKRRPRGIIIWD